MDRKNKILIFVTLLFFIILFINSSLNFLSHQEKIQSSKNKINNIKNELNLTNLSYNEIIAHLNYIKSNVNNALRDPTYSEVQNFINNDTTDKNNYSEEINNLYNCAHFSKDTNNNAEQLGIRCGFVVIDLTSDKLYSYPHACIAFKTVDNGIVFYEPQTDERVNLTIGNNYWKECVITNVDNNYNDKEDSYVESYFIIW